jgi:hypothetical protein
LDRHSRQRFYIKDSNFFNEDIVKKVSCAQIVAEDINYSFIPLQEKLISVLHGFKTIPELSRAIQVEGHMIDILLRVTSKGRIVTTTVNEAVDEYENKLTPL